MMPRAATPPPRLDGWILATGALIAYLALGQRSFYKIDGELFLWFHSIGLEPGGYHGVYLHFIAGAHALGSWSGLPLYDSALALSAAGTALGVVAFHEVGRQIGLDREAAAVAAALLAFAPAWLFFATVVELHGPFLPFAAFGTYMLVRLVRQPGHGRALAAGIALGLVFQVHPTAVLLLALLPLLARAVEHPDDHTRPTLHLLGHGGLAAVACLATALTVPLLLEAIGGATRPPSPHELLFGTALEALHPGRWLEVLWHELCIPYAPLVLTAAFAVSWPVTRRMARWLWLGLLPYLAVSLLLIWHGGERGAYLLPAAFGMALVASRLLRGRRLLAAGLIGAGAVLGVVRIERHEDPAPAAEYAAGFRQVAGERPILAIGNELDLAAHFLHLHDQPLIFLGQVMSLADEAGARAFIANLDRALTDSRRAGRRAFLSRGAVDGLTAAADSGVWQVMTFPPYELRGGTLGPRLLLSHLRENYRLAPVAARGFAGFEVLPR